MNWTPSDWIGLVGALTGLAALVFESVKYLVNDRPRLKVTARLVSQITAQSPEGETCVRIGIVNPSRCAAIVDAAGVWGIILNDDPVAAEAEVDKQRALIPRTRNRAPSEPSRGEAIVIDGGDARVFDIKVGPFQHKQRMSQVTGRHWGAYVQMRTGKRIEIPANKVLG